MKPTFLCYPKCSTCQKAAKWLTERGVEFEQRSIVDQNPSVDELREWLTKSALPTRRFFNTSGIKYREMGLKDRVATESEEALLSLLATDGMLVKRPLLITETKILVGFREKEYEALVEEL